MGKRSEGMRHLRRGVELAPDEVAIVRRLADALMRQGKPNAARKVIHASMFRNPRNPAFQSMWRQIQFDGLAHRQLEARQSREVDDRPMVLPFPRATGKVVRRDAPAETNGPHAETSSRRERRHA
jgi:hypothetical protein